MKCHRIAALSALVGIWMLWQSAAMAATFTVTNTAGSGAGSLNQAIINANTNAGPDTIAFAILPFDGTVKNIA